MLQAQLESAVAEANAAKSEAKHLASQLAAREAATASSEGDDASGVEAKAPEAGAKLAALQAELDKCTAAYQHADRVASITVQERNHALRTVATLTQEATDATKEATQAKARAAAAEAELQVPQTSPGVASQLIHTRARMHAPNRLAV